MMKNILTLLAITLLCACSKNDEEPNSENSKSKVYVVGSQSNGTKDVAKLWIDGTSIALTDGTKNANAKSVFVSKSNDVYVVGNEGDGENYMACIWKNNKKITLPVNPNQFSIANDIFVTENDDVYVVGRENNGVGLVAKLWKNGVATNLTDGSGTADATAVFVTGTDVYVVGYEYEDHARTVKVAKIWVNGLEKSLTNGFDDAYANDVYVSGNDVYVVGEAKVGRGTSAVYWKNGEEATLPNLGNGDCYAKSICIENNDVYIAGYDRNDQGNYVGKYWKNGKEFLFTDGTSSVYANGIFVKNNVVYVIGEDNRKSILWKNNEVKELVTGDRTFYNTAVFVK